MHMDTIKLRRQVGVALLMIAAVCVAGEVEETFRLGLREYASGRYADAARTFGPISQGEDMVSRAARFNRGLCLYHAGEFAAAHAAFASLTTGLDVTLCARAAFNAGNCSWRLAKPASAAERYRQALTLAGAELDRLARARSRSPQEERDLQTLAELCRRASFNLGLVTPDQEDPTQTQPTPDAHEQADHGAQGDAADTGGTEEGADDPDSAGGTPTPGEPKEGDVLERVLLRDSGPALPARGHRAAPGEPDW